ncbi:hypothetical protein [Sphingopyxis sp. UBA6734]|uniref:hypothetical protein n=1 Tax=Sphingopyxis sp. UBA6734 TaxID=1947539 RepID=UPI0025F2D780|nr:hypothetical protein [Sphingopyxis sp. UBA6734]
MASLHCFACKFFRDNDRQDPDILEGRLEHPRLADEELDFVGGKPPLSEHVGDNEAGLAARTLERKQVARAGEIEGEGADGLEFFVAADADQIVARKSDLPRPFAHSVEQNPLCEVAGS